MQPEEPLDEMVAPNLGVRSLAEVAEMHHSQTAEWFGFVLEGYVPEEMADAEIERAFRAALAEWRRTEPERAAKLAEMQLRNREKHAERQRYWHEHPEESPQPRFDPASVFQANDQTALGD
jgi:hypothetical protein